MLEVPKKCHTPRRLGGNRLEDKPWMGLPLQRNRLRIHVIR